MAARRLLPALLAAGLLVLLALPSPDPTPVVAKPACPGGLLVSVDLPFCTHGPDPRQASEPPPQATAEGIRCDGDGVAGKRVQAILARASDVQTTLPSLADVARWVAAADGLFDRSAQQTGGTRHLRWVTNPDCSLRIDQVTLKPEDDDNLALTIKALQARGHSSPDRKYLVFVDSRLYCGIATIENDDTHSSSNRSNTVPGYARVDRPCWGGATAAHELVHTLGGVQLSAPHSDDNWHCLTEWDLLCYGGTQTYLCPESNADLLDCDHDDYYTTGRDPYLDAHWNVADSAFFIGQPEPTPTPSPKTCWKLPILGRVCH